MYNADHFPECPYCSNKITGLSENQLKGLDESEINTSPVERHVEDMNTQSLVVGWLVCINGPSRGQYFPLFSGSNAIGRGSNMDIRLTKDLEISRLVHAEISYEPDTIIYSLSVNDFANPVYVNDKIVSDKPYVLSDRDTISIGAHTFIIVMLCNEQFSWR